MRKPKPNSSGYGLNPFFVAKLRVFKFVKTRVEKIRLDQEVIVNAMQKIAEIQCNVATLSILFFLSLSASFIPVVFSLSGYSVISTLSMIASWWIGVRLLIGYENISRGRVNIAETRKFWYGSLAFNGAGFLAGAVLLLNIRNCPFEFWLVLIPVFAGNVLAITALLILAS
jgi:hypothetical protein